MNNAAKTNELVEVEAPQARKGKIAIPAPPADYVPLPALDNRTNTIRLRKVK